MHVRTHIKAGSGLELAALAGLAIAAAGTAYSIASAPGAPAVPKPPPAPPAPPPPPPVPPPPSEAQIGTAVGDERSRLRRQRGITSTILTTPLGVAGQSTGLGS